MESSSQDKDLPATDRRLQQARDDGQVARSKDLTNLAVLGGGTVLVMSLFPIGLAHMVDALKNQLRFDHTSLARADVMHTRLLDTVASGLWVYMPLGLAMVVLALLATVGAGGWAASTKPIMPDLTRLSPLAGFGRLFSRKQVVEVAKLTVLTAVIGVIAWAFLAAHMRDFASLLLRPLDASLVQLGQWMTHGVGLLLLVVAVVAAIDVPVSGFLHRRELRMSHQEVKQEHKETEGNPQLKGRMRSLQREVAQRNSIGSVPKADLVVMNPTHYVVAIRYDDTVMRAPRVVAKGADLLAMKIREIARGHDVPVLQSPMLARALYAHAEIDQEIPAGLYTAVAQVLAYVYQVKAALKGQGPMPMAQPEPDVPQELDPHYRRPPPESQEVAP